MILPLCTSTHRGSYQCVGATDGLLAVGEVEGRLEVGLNDGLVEGATVVCANQSSSSEGTHGHNRDDPPATSTASQILMTG